jgi:hypothetical protein
VPPEKRKNKVKIQLRAGKNHAPKTPAAITVNLGLPLYPG